MHPRGIKYKNMNKNIVIILIVFIAGTLIVLYQNGMFSGTTKKTEENKIKIVASFYPLYYFSERIAGEKGEVINLTPAGAEPHYYEPSARDIADMETSNILVLNGANLEPWGEKIKDNIDTDRTTIVIAGENLATRDILENGESVIDPHIWLSPKLAEQMINKILEGFIQADAENTEYYTNNANTLKAELVELDNEYAEGLAECKNRNLVVSHSAFGYLAASYNLNEIAITGISPDAEPSPQKLADVAKFADDNGIKYIFFEELVSPKLSQTIANEIGAQTLVLNPLEGLSGKDISAGKNYFTEMRKNLTNLKTALQCSQ